jgi:hypothetical protein
MARGPGPGSRFFVRSGAAVALVAVLVVACSTGPTVLEPIVPDTTRVADAATLAALRSFDPTTGELRFDQETQALRDLRLDDVLVAEPTEAAPHGLLRRVHGIRYEGTEVVVATSQASITDAIYQGEVDATGVFTAADMLEPTVYLDGVTVTAIDDPGPVRLADRMRDGDFRLSDEAATSQVGIGDGYTFHIGLDEVLLDVNVEGVRVRMQLTGEIYFNAGYGVGLTVRPCFEVPPVCLRRFEASIGVEQRAAIRVTGSATAALGVERRVATIPFAPIFLFVGPVPVIFVPSVDVYVGGSGEVRLQFSYGVTERFAARIGARWTSSAGWQDITEFGLAVDAYDHIDVNATFRARIYVKPEGSLTLYGVVGPALTLVAGIDIDAAVPRDPVWRIRPFLTGAIAFVMHVPVLGKLGGYSTPLFEHTIEGRSSPNTPPEITVRQSRLRLPLRAEVWLSDNYSVRDRETPFVGVTLRSSRSGDDVRHGSASRFHSLGLRTLTIEAVDGGGLVTTRTFEVDVYNPPPVVFASVAVAAIRQSEPPPGFLVPLAISLGAVDPVDGRLPCSAITVNVTPPDTVTRSDHGSGRCEAEVHFFAPGTGTIEAFAVDADGIQSSVRNYQLTVDPPPVFPPPLIEGSILVNGAWRASGDQFPCMTNPYALSIVASDPTGHPLTIHWTLRHERLGSASPVATLWVAPGDPPTLVRFPTTVNPIPSWAPTGDGVGGPWSIGVTVSNGETTVGRAYSLWWRPVPCVH